MFSSGEFQNLKRLRALDLSYNKLTVIEDGLLEGCVNLKVRKGRGGLRWSPNNIVRSINNENPTHNSTPRVSNSYNF